PDLSTLLTPTSSLLFVFFSRLPRPPISTLFPYTTLFRSVVGAGGGRRPGRPAPRGHPRAPARTPGPAAPTAVPDHEPALGRREGDRKSTRLNSSHQIISYAVFCLKKKKKK